MKAIIVIEVDDKTDFSKAKANITMQDDEYGILLGNVGKKWYKDISLKPMPNEREEKDHYDFGWNDCVRVLNNDYNLCKLG